MWRSARQPLSVEANSSDAYAFRQGVIVNLSNPKSVLFAAAVLVLVFPAGLSFAASAVIVANHFIVEVVVYTLMAVALSTAPARTAYLRLKVYADRIAAGVMAGLGLRILLEK